MYHDSEGGISMKSRLSGVIGLCAVLLASACGGDDKGYGSAITVDGTTKTQISSMVSQAAGVSSVATSTPCNNEDLANLLALYESMTVLLDVKLAHKSGEAAPDRALALVLDAARAQIAAGGAKPAGTCVPGSGTVTFDNYTVAGGSINGTISFANGTFKADLTVMLTAEGFSITEKMKGSLTVTTTSIKGSLTITASGSFQGGTLSATYSSSYDLTIANNCATDGTIEVHASGNAQTQGANAKYDVWVKADFGPACGDVTIY